MQGIVYVLRLMVVMVRPGQVTGQDYTQVSVLGRGLYWYILHGVEGIVICRMTKTNSDIFQSV